MAYIAGAAGTLFHAVFNINCANKGFNLKFHLVGADYAAVTPSALTLADCLLPVLPDSAQIFYARVSNDNTRRDSRFLPGALGNGTSQEGAGPPIVPDVCNRPEDSMLVRFENTEGDSVSRHFTSVPDRVIADAAQAGGAVANVVGMPAAVPAVGALTAWNTNFNRLMQAIVKLTVFVKSGHAPGGAFQYALWENAYLLRTGAKKGGRVFA